ncbi:Tad3p NDAI_0I02480 [Naumovozyma dairenensis CBS 421]|uniref:CMP/dCMP-type deaminase domain-containing protein n=1 Tax=Naumovozyma dairenensis (strain ATCC 10597 / BCRC 20456 / CBS 421 / NBRC 0211 / NRRL Y-12639) TaxID=1071378 RepID=G0WGA5_NAUDC|nr:hypothetical protein NDAI_0I02480 [Naumovozyma dairenensis CBS 421]CCD26816.1 hypothetical protein NDAI_0I02480 [Naumovozyma dairenensis CBS 421]
MVKKVNNPLKIDFQKCIIEGRLQQILPKHITSEPELINIWTIDINPQDSKYFIAFIRRNIKETDPISLLHLKRIQKNPNDKSLLKLILCSVEYIADREDIIKLLESIEKKTPNGNVEKIQYTNLNKDLKVPKEPPITRELINEWSKKFWPMVWNGNPNDQILNDYIIDMDSIRGKLDIISKQSQSLAKSNEIPVVSLFVNPLDPLNHILSIDQRNSTSGCQLDHSIMNGIKKVAEDEVKRRKLEQEAKESNNYREKTYLCLNFDVYTTHEPCSMCSMALIHSRIKRLIFIKPMEVTGSLRPESGHGYCMHANKNLNSKYEVFQWIGDEYPVGSVENYTCC